MGLSSHTPTTDAYFDDVWKAGDDPWEHGTRWYEHRKYDLTVAALPRLRYTRSFEPGCGAGFLTQRLAARSEEHLAMERHPRGEEATRRRCAEHPTVRVVPGTIPGSWPAGRFDLIVLSEVLYYLGAADLDRVLDQAQGSLVEGGDLVAVHYRRPVADHAWTGDEVHDRLLHHQGWRPIGRYVDEDVRMDLVRR